jgi:hypothetical protein
VQCTETFKYGLEGRVARKTLNQWHLFNNIKMGLKERGLQSVAGSCECGNELSGSIKFWVHLEWLSYWQLLKKTHFSGVSLHSSGFCD